MPVHHQPDRIPDAQLTFVDDNAQALKELLGGQRFESHNH
jgi:hypothetical protein